MGVLLLVAKPDFFAVRQENKWDIELVCVSATLCFPGTQVDAGALGLENGKRAPLAIEQGVIRLAAVIERVFEANAAPVRQLPVDIAQKLVDLDPCEGLIRHARLSPSNAGSLIDAGLSVAFISIDS